MQFANYDAYRVAFMTLLDGEQRGQPTFELSTADLMLALGETRVHGGDQTTPGLRASTMVTPLSALVTSNVATLPATLLQLKEVFFDARQPLEIMELDRLRRLIAVAVPAGGRTAYAAQDGDTLVFWPQASGTVQGSYYARPADLKTGGLHTTFQRYPELYLYASLYEGALFLGLYDRAAVFERRYREFASGANHSEMMRVYGGSPLRQRSR